MAGAEAIARAEAADGGRLPGEDAAGRRWRPRPRAKQVCCLVDECTLSHASERPLLPLKYLNESCMNLELESGLTVLSVTFMDGTVAHAGNRPDRCASAILTTSTRIVFVYSRYHVAIALDTSDSMFCVREMQTIEHPGPVFSLPFSQLEPVLRTLLRVIQLPVSVPVSAVSITPKVRVTVVARGRTGGRYLLRGATLTQNNVESLAQRAAAALAASATTSTRGSGDAAGPSGEPTTEHASTIASAFATSPASEASEDLTAFLGEIIAALQCIDPSACTTAIVITDGVLPPAKPPMGDEGAGTLNILQRLDTPLNYVHLCPVETISGSFGAFPDITNMLLSSSATGGTCFDLDHIRAVTAELPRFRAPRVKKHSKRSKRRGKHRHTASGTMHTGLAARASSEAAVEDFVGQPDAPCCVRLVLALMCRFSQLDGSVAAGGAAGPPPGSALASGGGLSGTGNSDGLVAGAQASSLGPGSRKSSSSMGKRRPSFGSTSSSSKGPEERTSLFAAFKADRDGTLSQSSAPASTNKRNNEVPEQVDAGQAANKPVVPFYSPSRFRPALEPRVRKAQLVQPLMAIDHAYPWHGRPPAVPVCVNELAEYRVRLNTFDALLCRVKEGFQVKQVLYDQHVLCVRLELNYAQHVTINYVLKASRDPQRAVVPVVVSIRLIATADFLRAFQATGRQVSAARPNERPPQTLGIGVRLHQFVNSIHETDRVLVHLARAMQALRGGLERPHQHARRHAASIGSDASDSGHRREGDADGPSDMADKLAQLLLSGFAFEPLLRWQRWFHVDAHDLVFQTLAVRDQFVGSMIGEWATHVTPLGEDGCMHFVRILTPRDTADLEERDQPREKETEGFVRTELPRFVLGRVCVASDFLVSVFLAFPATVCPKARRKLVYRFIGALDTTMPGRVGKVRQMRKPLAALCHVSLPHSSLARSFNTTFYQPSFEHLHSFSQAHSWSWVVPDLGTANHVFRGLIRARIAENFVLTSCSLQIIPTKEGLTVDDSKSTLDSSGYASFYKLVPAFSVRRMRQSKHACLIQYRVSFSSTNVVSTDFWMEATELHFKPFRCDVIHCSTLRRLLCEHLEKVDSHLVSASVAFLRIQFSTTSDLIAPWTIPNSRSLRVSIPTEVSSEPPQLQEGLEGHDPSTAESDTTVVKVTKGVASLLNFATRSEHSLDTFKVGRDGNSTLNDKLYAHFRASLEHISDAQLVDEEPPLPGQLVACDQGKDVRLDSLEHSKGQAGAGGGDAPHAADAAAASVDAAADAGAAYGTFFAKVLDTNSVLIVCLPPRDTAVKLGPAIESGPAAGWRPSSIEVVYYKLDNRELAFPASSVDEHLLHMLAYEKTDTVPDPPSEDEAPAMLETANPEAVNQPLSLVSASSKWVREKLMEGFRANVRSCHLFDMVYTVHWIFAAEAEPDRLGDALHSSDVVALLRQCPTTNAIVDASLLSRILHSTRAPPVNNESEPSVGPTPEINPLQEIDKRFESLLREFFRPIDSSPFYYLDARPAMTLFQKADNDHDDDGEDEDEEDEEDGIGPDRRVAVESGHRSSEDRAEASTPSLGSSRLQAVISEDMRTRLLRTTNDIVTRVPPVFFRISCASHDAPKDTSVAAMGPEIAATDILDGHICKSILDTRQTGASQVSIKLVFCTLPRRPTSELESTARNPRFREKDQWAWTRKVRKTIRARVKAMVSSAVLTALQGVYPVTETTISLVQHLLERGSLQASSVSRMTIPLTFMNQEAGAARFAEHIGKTPGLDLRRVGSGDVYFVVEPLSRARGGTASSSGPDPALDTAQTATSATLNGSGGGSTSNEGQASSANVGTASIEHLLDDEANLWRPIAGKREYSVPYWAILTVAGASVSIEVHSSRLAEPGCDIKERLRAGIIRCVERVNQMLLLHELHETRFAHRLLIEPDASEGVPSPDAKGMGAGDRRAPHSGRRSAADRGQAGGLARARAGGLQSPSRGRGIGLDRRTRHQQDAAASLAGVDAAPQGAAGPIPEGGGARDPVANEDGTLACPCHHKEVFLVPERLHVAVAMHELRENTLHSFVVTNRRNTFVYRDKSGEVFYLKLKELIEDGPDSEKVLLEVYGVDPPSDEMKDMLHALLSNKIANATLSTLGRLLHRNPQFKVQPHDLAFIKSASPNKPQAVRELRVPASVHDELSFLLMFRQNLRRFMNHLHFAFPLTQTQTAPLTARGGASKSTRSSMSSAASDSSAHPALWPLVAIVDSEHGLDAAGAGPSGPASMATSTLDQELDARLVSPVCFLGAGQPPVQSEASFTGQNDPARLLVELRQEDFVLFFNSSPASTHKAKGAASSDLGSGIAVSFVKLCRDWPQTGDEEVSEAKRETVEVLETTDDLELLDRLVPAAGAPEPPSRPRSEGSLDPSGAAPAFTIVVELWESGGVKLDKLWDRHELAFQYALQEYAFEQDRAGARIEMALPDLRMNRGSFLPPPAPASAPDVAATEGEPPARSPTFVERSLKLDAGMSLRNRLVFLREISNLIAGAQPELSQLAAIDIASGGGDGAAMELFPLFGAKAFETEISRSTQPFVADDREIYLTCAPALEVVPTLGGLASNEAPSSSELKARIESSKALLADRVEPLAPSEPPSSSAAFATMRCWNAGSLVVRAENLASPHATLPVVGEGVPKSTGAGDGSTPPSAGQFAGSQARLVQRRSADSIANGAAGSTSSGDSSPQISSPLRPPLSGSSLMVSSASLNSASFLMQGASAAALARGASTSTMQMCTKLRRAHAAVRISTSSVSVTLYNWSPGKSKGFWHMLEFLLAWFRLRTEMLRNIFYQRMGLFAHSRISSGGMAFVRKLLSRIKPRSRDVSMGLDDLDLVLDNEVPPSEVVQDMTAPDEVKGQKVAETPNPRPNRRDTLAIARAAMESRKRGNRGPGSLPPHLMPPVVPRSSSPPPGLKGMGSSVASGSSVSIASIGTGPDSSGLGRSGKSTPFGQPGAPGFLKALPPTHRGRALSGSRRSSIQSTLFGSGVTGKQAQVAFEKQLQGQAQRRLLQQADTAAHVRPVKLFGGHLVREARYWGGVAKREALVKGVVARWRQEWIGQSVQSSRFPYAGHFEESSDLKTCSCSASEMRELLRYARVVHCIRAPTFLKQHGIAHVNLSKDDFSRQAEGDLVRVYVHYLVHQLGMRQIVISDSAHQAPGSTGSGGPAPPAASATAATPIFAAAATAGAAATPAPAPGANSTNANSSATGSAGQTVPRGGEAQAHAEAYVQKVLNGALVVLHVSVRDGVLGCTLRLLEPALKDKLDIAGEEVAAASREDLFLMGSARPSGLTFSQELVRIRSSLNLGIVAYDFHIYMFQRVLKRFRVRPVGIACQVFHFANHHHSAPMGSQNALMRQEFAFVCGVSLEPEQMHEIFRYVVRHAAEYGIAGIRPTGRNGKHYLFLCCSDGSFQRPLDTPTPGFSYSVVVGESLRSASQDNHIHMDVCLMASNDSSLSKVLGTDSMEDDGAQGSPGGVEAEDSEDDADSIDLDGDGEPGQGGAGLRLLDSFGPSRSRSPGPGGSRGQEPGAGLGGATSWARKKGFQFFNRKQHTDSVDSEAAEEGSAGGRTSPEPGEPGRAKPDDPEGVCSMEVAFDNVDLFLHKLFSLAVLRYQRRTFWQRLRQISATGSTRGRGSHTVKVSELTDLALRCDISEVDSEAGELLDAACASPGLIDFLCRTYGPLALPAEETPDTDVVILPSRVLSFCFVLHVSAPGPQGKAEIKLCFPKAKVSERSLADGQVFLTALIQTLDSWIWQQLDLPP